MLLVEFGVLALALASCGGGDGGSPNRLRSEPDAGDEQPISVEVRVRLSADDVTVRPRRVAAFLPLRFVVDSEVSGEVAVRGVGRRAVEPGRRVVLRDPGLEPGRVRITGPGGAAVLQVRPGG